MEMLTTFYPQLKSLEKLENFEKLNLTQEDIRNTVSEVLKATNITPDAIDVKIEEKVKKRFSDVDKGIATIVAEKLSDVDKGIATIVAEKLNEIDKRFRKPVGYALDYLKLGNAEFDKKNYQKAIEYYDKAIELKPNYAEAWGLKGGMLDKLGRPDEALKALDKAIEIKSDDANIWGLKGGMLANLGRYEEALKVYDKAIELKPDYAISWYSRACVYSLKGDKENALKNLPKAIELDAKYKEMAKKDEDFKNLWDDKDLKKIINQRDRVNMVYNWSVDLKELKKIKKNIQSGNWNR